MLKLSDLWVGIMMVLTGLYENRLNDWRNGKSPQRSLAGLIVVLVISFAYDTRADLNGNDDFNGTALDTNKWSISTTGAGRFTETNQQLEYTTTGTPTSSDLADLFWILQQGNYDSDWTVQLDVNQPFTPTGTGQGVQIGLAVARADDTSYLSSVFLGAGVDGRFFESHLGTTSGSTSQSLVTTATSGAVRFRWSAATQILSADYGGDAAMGGYSWTNLVSWNIGAGAFDWNMNPNSMFEVAIFGNSQSVAVSATNQVFVDNFICIPKLNISQSNNVAVLSWSTNATGFLLESASNLSAQAAWLTVTNAPFVTVSNNAVTNGIATGNRFYRLMK